MKFKHKIKGLKAIGIGNALRAFPYAWYKGRLDRRFQKSPKAGLDLPPGRLLRAVPETWGVTASFDNASLEARFLTPKLIRLTWTPGVLPVPYATGAFTFESPSVTVTGGKEGWSLDQGAHKLVLGASGAVQLFDSMGTLLWHDLPPVHLGNDWLLTSKLHKEAGIFGGGERTSPLNLRPGTYRFFNREPRGTYKAGDDPLYLGIPFFLSICPDGCVGVFHENSHDGTLEVGEELKARFTGGALRIYLFLGTPAEILDSYTQLTGRPAMPPRWALGYHQSRWSYMNQQEVEALVEDFASHQMPLSAVHLDIHYMDGYRVFTVDRKRFPDMAGLARKLKARDVHLVTILDPGVKADPAYDLCVRGFEGSHFVKASDQKVVKGPVWPGACFFPDFTRPKTRSWWSEYYKRIADWGVDGVWHDMNEPAIFTPWGQSTMPLGAHHDMDGRGGNHQEAHNLYGFLEGKAGFEGLQAARPEARPWILSRSGWAGMQKYMWNWTGDCPASWWMVKQSIRMSLQLACSGVPYTGPDIGGFSGEPDGEMFARWFQAAAFLPFFRVHSAAFVPRREPWSFGKPFTEIAREYLKLRYRMLPYWYTAAWRATQQGLPLVRPMIFDYPSLLAFAKVDDQFMLGNDLIVAPVVNPGTKQRTVLLPPGDWVNFWTDECLEGGREVTVAAELDIVPVFVRAGAVLPLLADGGLELNVYIPGVKDDADGELYSDSGDGYGPGRVDRFRCSISGRKGELTWESEGEYPQEYARVKVVLRGRRADQAEIDGSPVAFEQNVLRTQPFKTLRFLLTR